MVVVVAAAVIFSLSTEEGGERIAARVLLVTRRDEVVRRAKLLSTGFSMLSRHAVGCCFRLSGALLTYFFHNKRCPWLNTHTTSLSKYS